MSDSSKADALIGVLQDELRLLVKSVAELTVALARQEERQRLNEEAAKHVEAVRANLIQIDRRMVKLSGVDGNNGDFSELVKAVRANSKKLESLMMSRASLMAVAGFASAVGGLAVKFFS